MKLFRRKNEVTLNRIHHTVIVNENGEKMKLVVNADPMRLTAGITKARTKMTENVLKKKDPTEKDIMDAAMFFSIVLFGNEQTQRLFDFYAGDAGCVMNICAKVFQTQLSDKISAAQKRMKV